MTTTSISVMFTGVTFTGSQIRSAIITEQVHPVGLELPTASLELTLFSSDGDFSILDPGGFYANLKYKMPLELTVIVDGVSTYRNTYYLDKWESLSETEAKFYASDRLALLDGVTYNGAFWYAGDAYVIERTILSQDLVNQILGLIGFSVSMHPSLMNINMYGHIPVCTGRDALQQVCFALGAYALCSYSESIELLPAATSVSMPQSAYVLPLSETGTGRSISLRPLVTGVKLTTHTFRKGSTTELIVDKDSVGVGTFTAYSPNGIQGLSSEGTATYSYPNFSSEIGTHFLTVSVTVAGSMKTYTQIIADTPSVVTVLDGSVPGGTKPNVITVNDATMVTAAIGQQVTQRVSDYYKMRYLQKARVYGKDIVAGYGVLIQTQGGKWIQGVVEKSEIDLTGGLISDIELVGLVYPCDNVLAADIVTSADITYSGCLDMLNHSITLNGTASLIIT